MANFGAEVGLHVNGIIGGFVSLHGMVDKETPLEGKVIFCIGVGNALVHVVIKRVVVFSCDFKHF